VDVSLKRKPIRNRCTVGSAIMRVFLQRIRYHTIDELVNAVL